MGGHTSFHDNLEGVGAGVCVRRYGATSLQVSGHKKSARELRNVEQNKMSSSIVHANFSHQEKMERNPCGVGTGAT